MKGTQEYILTLSCPDATGIVHAVSGLLYQAGCNIVDSQQFGDVAEDDATGRFFMRVHFAAPPQLSDTATLEALFGHVRKQFGLALHFHAREVRPRLMLMVSQHGHCLNDLLFRVRSNQMAVDVPCVVSNHTTHAELVRGHGVAFHHLPLAPGADASARQAQEQRVLDLVRGERIDLVVLALLSFSVVGDGMYALTDGWAWWVRGIAFSVLVLVLTSAVHLPVGFWAGYLHEHHWELSTQSLGGWWRDRLKGLAVTVALTTSLLVGLLAVARVFPAAWPVIVAGASALVVFGLSFVSPVVLEPLFNRFRPLPDRELAMTLRDLAARAGVGARPAAVRGLPAADQAQSRRHPRRGRR